VQSSDVLIAGGGIIGLSLAIELRRLGATVTVLDRGEPGREASYAAAGMLAATDPDLHPALRPLAQASASMYADYVHDLELHSGLKTGFEQRDALYLAREGETFSGTPLPPEDVAELEASLAQPDRVFLLRESSVDPRLLTQAALSTAKKIGAIVHHEGRVDSVALAPDRHLEVKTQRGMYHSSIFVNCCGAWSGEVAGAQVPTHPVKGQMLAVIPIHRTLRHTVRSVEVYLLPRSDGRVLIGATVEDAGFDKTVDADTIQRLHQAAANLVPAIGEARMIEAWAGLRPGSPDGLPILGPGSIPGTFIATGHFRNGILLAPVTAVLMRQLIEGKETGCDLRPFSPRRFSNREVLAG
jgi:glycine oxidase